MTSQERLATRWPRNATVPESVQKCVHDLIRERTKAQPHAEAVFAYDGSFSYSELDSVSEEYAKRIAPLVESGTIIPLCFSKSALTPVAVLAVLKAGCAFVLLDPAQPETRLRSIVEQTQASLICSSSTTSDLSRRLLRDGGTVLVLDASSPVAEEAAFDGEPHLPKSSPASLAYEVFTSGSTGIPKGAMLSHSNICSAFHYQLDQLGFSSSSRVYDFASYSFDVAVHTVLATLVAGGCLCIPSNEARLHDSAQAMEDMGATIANLTPSFAPLLDPRRLSTLRTLLFLGEPLSRHEVQRWQHSGVSAINTYGPAEYTPIATINDRLLETAEPSSTSPEVSMGVGAGSVCWVVQADDHHVLCEPYEIDELLLEGPIIGMGYLNNLQRTNEAFMTSASWLSSVRSNSRLYKTGDLVQRSGDGSLRFMGRKDIQIKVAGQRVELGEVEYHVQSCFPYAIQTIVELVGSKSSPSLTAVLHLTPTDLHVVHSDQTATSAIHLLTTESRTIEELAQKLPRFMIPTTFYAVQDLPRTASGKVDRRNLRELVASYQSQRPDGSKKCRPTTGLERKLQSIWADVLDLSLEDIGLEDHFLHQGGDSLAAIRLVGAAREQGLELHVADIFQYPILNNQARIVRWAAQHKAIPPFSIAEGLVDVGTIAALSGIEASIVEDAFPCTPLQEGLFSLTVQRSKDYICQMVLPISKLEVEAVKTAWERTVQAVPILRTRIVQITSGLLQVVLKDTVDWQSASNLEACRRAGFEVSSGSPLVHFALAGEDGDDPDWLVLSLHHSLYDAWSLDLFVETARAVYESDAPPRPECNFSAFVQYLQSTKGQLDTTTYWSKALENTQSVQFPSVRSMQQAAVSENVNWTCELPQRRSRIPVATLSTTIRAALAIIIAKHTDSNDVRFGVTVSGRNVPIPGIERIGGQTINSLPIRAIVDPAITISQFTQGLQQQAYDMIPYEQTSLLDISKLGEGP